MIKEINYAGHTAVPSDYDCPDGELALSINLINEDGALTPVAPPQEIQRIKENDFVVAIHKHTDGENIIFIRDGHLCWRKMNSHFSDQNIIAPVDEFRDIAIIGNTLCISSGSGVAYALFINGSYKYLGSRPPFITIDFGLENSGLVASQKTYPDVPAHLTAVGGEGGSGASRPHPRVPTKEETADLSQQIYSHLFSGIAENVIAKGLFYQPFFVRYAFRLFDGTYQWHSAPVLMLPTILVPAVSIDNITDGSDSSVKNVKCSLAFNSYQLNYRIVSDFDWDKLNAWSDIIASVDIFVSAPIYTYDQSKSIDCSITSLLGLYSGCESLREGHTGVNMNRGRNSLASPASTDSTPTTFFAGHYNSGNGHYQEHTVTPGHEGPYWSIPPQVDFVKNLKSVHDFYKIASIEIKGIKAMEHFGKLVLDSPDLSNLVQLPTLPDDYQSHCDIRPDVLYSYNNRLNMAGVERQLAEPFPMRSCTPYNNPENASACNDYTLTVWTKSGGVSTCRKRLCRSASDMFYNPHKFFPRYIYYPDATAYKMQFIFPDNTKITIPLEPHDFLNGAFYFGGLKAESTPPDFTDTEETSRETIHEYSKLYTSEPANPFVFPATGINTIGHGRILQLSSAARALSQGQFGQFPLYAFTTEGVWALEVSASGAYKAKQPITRDVCSNPDGIAQIDSAVLFPSDRGIMLISGSDTTCISDTVNDRAPFDPFTLPHMEKLHEIIGHSAKCKCLKKIPFLDFIKECHIVYDYIHQHIVVGNRNMHYAYLYSLKSKKWGMMRANIQYGVESYPRALVVTDDARIVDFSSAYTYQHPIEGVMITRPLKLDAPDVLKTISCIIQRGNFRKGRVQTVLYGSRDLNRWFLVWSSKDHYLRGFRGTPYKYFRIALVTKLMPHESISGASIMFEPRYTNRLR